MFRIPLGVTCDAGNANFFPLHHDFEGIVLKLLGVFLESLGPVPVVAPVALRPLQLDLDELGGEEHIEMNTTFGWLIEIGIVGCITPTVKKVKIMLIETHKRELKVIEALALFLLASLMIARLDIDESARLPEDLECAISKIRTICK